VSWLWRQGWPAGDPLARFTPRARKVFQLANQEANRLCHDHVGTEHLVLGLVKARAGPAFETLSKFGFDLPMLRDELGKLSPATTGSCLGVLPRRADIQRTIDCAQEKAGELNHDLVGTGHLLLALLLLPDTKGHFLLGQVTGELDELRVQILAALTSANWTASESHVCFQRPGPDALFADTMGFILPINPTLAAIHEQQAKWLQAERSADWDAIASLCTEDTVWAPPNHPVLQGRVAIHAWGSALPRTALELSETLTDIAFCGATVYVRGVYSLRPAGNSPQDQPSSSGTFLRVLRRRLDSTWLVAFDTWSLDPPRPSSG
jgi:ketosteroid isomerase-like protein